MPVEELAGGQVQPRPVIGGGAVLAGLGWVVNAAASLGQLYLGAVLAGLVT